MLSFEDALRIVLENVPPPETEETPLADAAGRALARDVVADRDAPPCDSSAMDGYAVRAADAARGGVLRVTEEIVAGRLPTAAVGPGEAAAIMTGAPLPDGADAVVKIEDTERTGDGKGVRAPRTVALGDHIRVRGENRRAGDVVLAAGTEIGVGEIAVLATVGLARVPVFRRPELAVAATGDELVPVEAEPGPGRIRNSNGPTLLAQARAAGARTIDLGIVPDDPEALRQAIREGLASDVLLLCGGVSMGTRDLVPDVLADEDVEIVFHRVRLKPGKPLLFGRRGTALLFGLPGNPVSTFVTFELFVRPALRLLAGHRILHRPTVHARLGAPLRPGGPRRQFAPARIVADDGGLMVTPVRWRGSGDPFGLPPANALLVVREEAPARSEGETVEAVPLDDALAVETS